MSANIVNAASAYTNALKVGKIEGLEARDKESNTFSEMIGEASREAIDTLREAETQSVKAVTKEANLVDVVTAVGNAEVTLQTVVAVRDRVIQAYQDIIRMPI